MHHLSSEEQGPLSKVWKVFLQIELSKTRGNNMIVSRCRTARYMNRKHIAQKGYHNQIPSNSTYAPLSRSIDQQRRRDLCRCRTHQFHVRRAVQKPSIIKLFSFIKSAP